ncbi:MAG: peptidylprolyl isomerase, partial [Bacteroidales bacterium]
GYHLVKVRDRLPAMGSARVAHIMVMTPGDADQDMRLRAKERINEIYEKVQSGEAFEELARQYSEDQSSAARGGEMPAFQSNRMVPEFIEAIGSLKQAGDISPPVRTSFGWHIIKLLERNPVPEFDDIKEDLHNRVVRDSRGQLSQDAVVNQLKKEYGFGENLSALQAFFDIVDESFFQPDSLENMDSELDERLFWFGPHTFYQKDFASFLRENYAPRVRMNYRNLVAENYKRFVQERLIAYEDGFLESKYPEFRAIMKEYHDGILLFEITDQVVWSKAVEDSVGLNAFFQENRDRYMWEERLDVTIYSAPDADVIQQARDILSRSQDLEDVRELVLDSINAGGNQKISAQDRKLQKGDHPVTGMIEWKPGIYGPLMSNGQVLLVQVHEVLPPRRQEKEEVMGLVIADFQNHLERQWVRDLRRKYEVVVNQDVLETIQF